MSRWAGQLDELLYEGEEVRERLTAGDGHVVVTSHRILAFTPTLRGANFRQVDRPNVVGVEPGSHAPWGLLRYGLAVGVGGVVLVLAGALFDPASVIGQPALDAAATAGAGLDGVFELVELLFAIVLLLDVLLWGLGLVALATAGVLLGVYWYLRTPTLVIKVAGNDDIHVPRPPDAAEAAVRLEAATFPEPESQPDSGTQAATVAGEDDARDDSRPEMT